MGLCPEQLYSMALWEFNACVRAYNDMRESESRRNIAISWQTANLTGAAFAGKLKPLKHFISEEKVVAPKLTPEQIARLDQRFAERRVANGS